MLILVPLLEALSIGRGDVALVLSDDWTPLYLLLEGKLVNSASMARSLALLEDFDEEGTIIGELMFGASTGS